MAGAIERARAFPENVFEGRLPDHLATELALRLYALQCEILEAVTQGLDIDYVADLLCRRLEELAPEIACSILLIEDGRLHPLAAPSLPKPFVEAIRGLPIGPDIGSCGAAAFLGRDVNVIDISQDPRWAPYKELPLAAGLRACWSGPITSRDGRVIGTFALYFRACRGPDRQERQFVSSCLHLCTLIIERQHALAALTRTNRFLDTTLDTISQGLCLFDDGGTLKVVNRRFPAIYGLAPDSVRPGLTLAEVVRLVAAAREGTSPDELPSPWHMIRACEEPHHGIERLADGRVVAVSVLPVGDGSCLTTVEDVTERHNAEARISYMAHHDALTGLPNRVAFHEMLGRTCGTVPCALLTLDLDRFKAVNDGFGHPVGDRLLSMVAHRLRQGVGPRGHVTRLGGDEFAVLVTVSDDRQAAGAIAAAIIDELARPFPIDGRSIEVAVSIGIAFAAADEDATPEQLLRHSDIALYRAKRDRPGTYRFYDQEMSRRIEARRLLEVDLRHAVRDGEFQLYYQPVVSLRTARVTGFEALLRWNHSVRGMVSPAVFVPLAEETGLIKEIGAWALRTACTAAQGWPDGVKVAVNLSAVQFGGDVVGTVRDALAATGLAPARLDLEITESILLNNSADIVSGLQGLRDIGVQISMDDFGTGYSSLSYLNRFPLTRIKIDRSFVSPLPQGREALAVVRAVMGLGKTLNMVTTAEGVETMEQLETLRAEGCDEAQGYLFSRPLPAALVPEMLARAARPLGECVVA